MTAIHERHRNSIKAGVLMTVALIVALGVTVTLTNLLPQLFDTRNVYVVEFSVKEGVGSLSTGSVVRVGGIERGKVTAVDLIFADRSKRPDRDGAEEGSAADPGAPDKILVTFELAGNVPMFSNAKAYVNQPLIGGGAWIDILSVGGHPGVELTAEANQFRGSDSGPMLAALLGADGAADATDVISNVKEFTDRLNGEYHTRVASILENTDVATGDIRALAETIQRDDWPRWTVTVNRILDNALSASEKLDLAMDDGRQFIDDGRALITNANEGVDDMRAMIDHNRPSVDEFVANIKAASVDVQRLADRLATETADKVDALLDRGVEAVDSFGRLGHDLEAEFDNLAPSLRDVMANASVASTELALATTEVRHAPWKLLFRPSTDELEYENLYFAANRFALASSELKIASQSIERAVAAHREYLHTNPTALEEMVGRLQETYRRYEQSQQDLLDILKHQTN